MVLALLGGLVVLAAIPYVLYVVGYRILRPTGSPATKSTAIEPVSILLPTYNEAGIVSEKLRELCTLSYPVDELEIVVVDSSDDNTATAVRAFFAERERSGEPTPRLTLIEESDRGGVARAVNRGVEAAEHDVIFRTDCDSTLDADVLTHAVANLQDSRIGGVTGRQVEVIGDSTVETSYRDLQARNQALESHVDSTFIVHGPCFAFRKRYFEPIATDSLADDTEIAVGIRKRGKRIVMDPAMRFAEVGVSGLRARRNRKDRRAMGLLQLLGRNRDLLGTHGRYGRLILPFNWFFLVVSPGLSVLLFVLTAVSLGVFAGLPGLIALVTVCSLFVALGSRDRLDLLQPGYAVVDSQFSLVIAAVRLYREGSDGTWETDTDSRTLLNDDT